MVTVEPGRHVGVVADLEYFIAGPFLRQSGPTENGHVLRRLGELCLLSANAPWCRSF